MGMASDIAPRFFVDAMFKDVPGAEFDEDSKIYILPCDSQVNVSLSIGYVSFGFLTRELKF